MKLINEITQLIKEEAGGSKHIYLDAETKEAFFFKQNINSHQDRSFYDDVKPSERDRKESGDVNIMRKQHVSKESMINCSGMSFEQMQDEITRCKRCILCSSRTNTVFGEGNPKAELMFIGEGPGRDEDEQGRPFVGKSGQLLTRMINAMGYQREDVYIANIVKCRPPNNRAPLPNEAEGCLPFLLRQIEIVNPRVIVLLGAVPLKYLLNKTGITKIHGEWFDFNGIKTIASFHPAFLLRDPRQKKPAWEDLQKAMKVLGKNVNPL